MPSARYFPAVFCAALLILGTGGSRATTISFASLDPAHPHNVSGTLYLPANATGPVPAVVMVHGTSGIDQRGELYRQPLLTAGIAIFEVDFKTGIYTGPSDRPKPDTFLPLAFAALKQLRKIPTIDPNRIGYMGFSMGGTIGLRAAVDSNVRQWMTGDKGFTAFALFYPVCKQFIPEFEKSGSRFTAAPMVIFYGTADSYGDGEAVPQLKRLLATKYNFQLTTVEYPGASHGFNRNGPDMDYYDPAAIHMKGHIAWDPKAAGDSITQVVAFLRENLSAK